MFPKVEKKSIGTITNSYWIPCYPGGRFNLTKYDDKYEEVFAEIHGEVPDTITKDLMIITIIQPTDSNPNWIWIWRTYPRYIMPIYFKLCLLSKLEYLANQSCFLKETYDFLKNSILLH